MQIAKCKAKACGGDGYSIERVDLYHFVQASKAADLHKALWKVNCKAKRFWGQKIQSRPLVWWKTSRDSHKNFQKAFSCL